MANPLGEDYQFRTAQASMDKALAEKSQESRDMPKDFHRDTPADQARVKDAYYADLMRQADTDIAGMRRNLEAGQAVGPNNGIVGLGSSKTRPEDYYISKAVPTQAKSPTPEEMMRMADELEQQYVDQLAQGPSVGPALERDSVTEAYVPHTTGYKPPDWLAKYMENVPTTGTTMVDPLGYQRYSQEKERLRKLKALK